MTYPPHIDLSQPCWITTGATNGSGYGLTKLENAWLLKHRVSHQLHNGPITPDMFVLHACDTPACWNPAHLFAADHQTNVDDMVSKGRHPHGETHGSAVLTEDNVREIRAAPSRSGGALARKFGVSRNVIYAVRKGLTWKHLDNESPLP